MISFQNGVVKDDILKRLLGERAVAGGVAYIAATIAEPGLIRHTGAMQKLVFGEYDGRPSDRLRRFAEACAAAGIDFDLSPHIRRTLWEKFVFLVGLSGTTATMRVPIGTVRSHPRSRAFLRDLMDETVQVARAEGVDLPAGFADDRLAFCDQLPATMTSSMHHDLQRGVQPGRVRPAFGARRRGSGPAGHRGQRLRVVCRYPRVPDSCGESSRFRRAVASRSATRASRANLSPNYFNSSSDLPCRYSANSGSSTAVGPPPALTNRPARRSRSIAAR